MISFKVGEQVIIKGMPKNFKRVDSKATILRKTVENGYYWVKLWNGVETVVSTDFIIKAED